MTHVDPAYYAEGWSDIESAPRDGTWIEVGFVKGHYASSPRLARTSGQGDAPNIWRFSNGGCLHFDHERFGRRDDQPSLWRWRPIPADRQAAVQAEYEQRRWGCVQDA